MATGAWLVEIYYSGGPNLKPNYPSELPDDLRVRVLHLPEENTTVDCPIIGAEENDDIPDPPCWWDPDYVWPDPPDPPCTEAPQNDQSLFIGAVDNIEKKITQAVLEHAFCHDPSVDDVAKRWLTLCQIVSGAGYNDPE